MTVFAGDPINAATMNLYLNRPLCRLVASGADGLADNTAVALPYDGTDDIDTHGIHDPVTNNTRITPNLEGYYEATVTAFFETQATPVVSATWVRKNGATNLAAAGRYPGATQGFSLTSTVQVAMNGTSDYLEHMAQQDSAGADNTNQSSQFSSTFEVKYLRPL